MRPAQASGDSGQVPGGKPRTAAGPAGGVLAWAATGTVRAAMAAGQAASQIRQAVSQVGPAASQAGSTVAQAGRSVVGAGRGAAATALSLVADRLDGGRVWLHHDQAHIRVHVASTAFEGPELADKLEHGLRGVAGVRWAAWNAALGRVVVAFEPGQTRVDDLVEVVDEFERSYGPPVWTPPAGAEQQAAGAEQQPAGAEQQPADAFEPALEPPAHPTDPVTPLRHASVLASSVLAFGGGLAGRALRAAGAPTEVSLLPTAVEYLPRLRTALERRFGAANVDTVLAMSSGALSGVALNPAQPLAELGLRAVLLAEALAGRHAFGALAPALHRDAVCVRSLPTGAIHRPRPLPDGPIERYIRGAGRAVVGAAAVAVPLGGVREAARLLVIGNPRAARMGRDAYAGQAGRVLADRGVLALDPRALRRLDRVDTVVIDASALHTGRMRVGDVLSLDEDLTAEAVRVRAAAMLDPDHPRRLVRGSGFTLGPLRRTGVPVPADLVPRARAAGLHRALLGLARQEHLVAVLTLEPEIDPMAEALAGATGAVGMLLLAGTPAELDGVPPAVGDSGRTRESLAARLHAAGTVPGGERLAASVRRLQADGHGVLLISAGHPAALAAADCGIGVLTAAQPPWGAHLLSARGLAGAWLALRVAAAARPASARSTQVALLGAAAGGLLEIVGRRRDTAPLPAGVAALVNVLLGYWSALGTASVPLPVPADPVPWHALSAREALRELRSDLDGLAEDVAAARRRPAEPAERPAGLVGAIAGELNNPLTAPLAAGAGLSAAIGAPTDALLVLSVLLGNAAIGGTQRLLAERTLRRLTRATGVRVRLRRGGEQRLAGSDDLVRGDVISLRPGDAVPADARLIEAHGMEVDESAVTGESMPVTKGTQATTAVPVAERTSMVYAGTTIAAGTGTALVVATGTHTQAGRAAAAVRAGGGGGVEGRLRALAATTVPAALAGGAALLATGLLRGRPGPALNAAVGLGVAAVPEGLPAIATIAQLGAARRLARRRILVRDPRTMQALGRVDVMCFDKTGTLTEGRIHLVRVSDGRDALGVADLSGHHRMVLAAALRATPELAAGEPLAHPTDQAVAGGGTRAGVSVEHGAPGWRAVRELPFEPGRGYHAVLGALAAGQMISVKGAPEIVLPRCAWWRRGEGLRRLTAADRAGIRAEADRLARAGFRVLAVAERDATARRLLDGQRVDRLEFLGLLGLADPARIEAARAVRDLRRAGVDVIMLTGDHPSTAESVATALGLLADPDAADPGGDPPGDDPPDDAPRDDPLDDPPDDAPGSDPPDDPPGTDPPDDPPRGLDGVVTGADLDAADDATRARMIASASVFARVTPEHKVTIVRELRAAGRVVAVTGDGANDVPAIRLADVGIALGDRGTNAAREAADLVITDDRIETIVHALLEGRAMWVSVREALALLLGGNLGEVLFTVGSSVLSPAPSLNARQLLLVNLVTDLLPALSIAARPPRHIPPQALAPEGPEASLGDTLAREVGRRAAATAIGAAGGWLAARYTGTRTRASTVALASLVGGQLAQTALASRGDPVVLATTAASWATLVAAVQTPVVSRFFGCRPLGPVGWTIVGGWSGAAALIGRRR